MNPYEQVDQHAANIVGSQPLVAPATAIGQGISPIIEYLLQMLGAQQQPQKAFKSSEMMGRPMPGPQPTSTLRGQMTGRPTEY